MELEKAKINLETAKIRWAELQLFFASGKLFRVSAEEDLTEVAQLMSQDNAGAIESLLRKGALAAVSDGEAKDWSAEDALLWAVVVKPYVLVQGV